MFNLLLTARGRINRRRYWRAFLIQIVLASIVGVILVGTPHALPGVVTVGHAADGSADVSLNRANPVAIPMAFVVAAGYLLLFYSAICVAIKRLHDRDASGWKAFIAVLPVVGGLWYFVEVGCLAGTPGPNQFGPDPLRRDAGVLTA